LADGAHATGAEVVDVIDDAVALAELHEVLRGLDDVLAAEDALFEINIHAELLVDLVAADLAEVVALGIEEEALEERLGVGGGRGLAGTETLVDFLEGFLLVAGRVLFEGAHDGTFVHRGVDHADNADVALLEGAHDLLGEGLEGAGEHYALVGVNDVLDEREGGDVVQLEGFGNLEITNVVEELKNLGIVREAEGAEQGRDENLAAAAAAVEIDVEQAVVVELDFEPGAA